MDKPDVDSIDGLSPAIAIDQKTTSRIQEVKIRADVTGSDHCPVEMEII